MQRVIMKSNIHRATATRAEVGFAGSCGVAPEMLRASDGVLRVRDMRNAARPCVDAQHRSFHEQAAIA
jgi:aspartate 1-decarboxylase